MWLFKLSLSSIWPLKSLNCVPEREREREREREWERESEREWESERVSEEKIEWERDSYTTKIHPQFTHTTKLSTSKLKVHLIINLIYNTKKT